MLGVRKGADPWDCAHVSPVGQWAWGQEFNPVPSGTREVHGSAQPASCLGYAFTLRDMGQTNPGIRAALCLGDEQIPGSSAHHRTAELEPQHWGLDVPPG